DVNGRLVTVNRAGRRLLGYGDAEIGRRGYRDLLAGAGDREVAAIAAAMEAGQGWRGQVTGWSLDGRQFSAYLSLASVFDARGQRIGAVGVLRDLAQQVGTPRRPIPRAQPAPGREKARRGLAPGAGGRRAGAPQEPRTRRGVTKRPTTLLWPGEIHPGPLPRERAPSSLSGSGEMGGIINTLRVFPRDTRLDRGEYELAR